MKFVKLLIAVFLVMPLTVTYGDAVVTFNWTPPTQNTDGTPLADSQIAGYNIYCNNALVSNVPNTGGTSSFDAGVFVTADYVCTATTINTDGVEGPLSNELNFTVSPSTPGAPSNFDVTFQ